MSRSSHRLRIGELSARSGVSPRSLRYYEQHDLIDAHRAPNGYREYDESMVERATAIRLMFDLGFSRDTVATTLTCVGDVPESAHAAVAEQLAQVRADLEAQMRQLAESHRLVSNFLDQRASIQA